MRAQDAGPPSLRDARLSRRDPARPGRAAAARGFSPGRDACQNSEFPRKRFVQPARPFAGIGKYVRLPSGGGGDGVTSADGWGVNTLIIRDGTFTLDDQIVTR